jgi:hypothetical protein
MARRGQTETGQIIFNVAEFYSKLKRSNTDSNLTSDNHVKIRSVAAGISESIVKKVRGARGFQSVS